MSSKSRQPSKKLLKELREKMIKRKLFTPGFRFSQMYSELKRFIDNDMVEYVSWVDCFGVREVVEGVLGVVEKEMLKERLLIRVWMKVFVVHGVFQLVIKNNHEIGDKLFPFLIEQLSQYHVDLNTAESIPNHNNSSRSGSIFSRSVSKIKRSLSTNSIKKLFVSDIKSALVKSKDQERSKDEENEQCNITSIVKNYSIVNNGEGSNNNRANNFLSTISQQSNQKPNINMNKNNEENSIEKALTSILHEYIKYLQHILANWQSLNKPLSPYIRRIVEENILQLSSSKEQKSSFTNNETTSSEIVWKLLNYFHVLSKICKDFHKICTIIIERYEIYMYGFFNFVADDLLFLYNPVADYVMREVKAVKWEEVIKIIGTTKDKRSLEKFSNNNKKEPPIIANNHKKLPEEISQHIFELKTMIDELGNANEVVLYVFNGYHHSKQLMNKKRPRSFISLNDNKFDVVFHVFKRLEEKEERGSSRRDEVLGEVDVKRDGNFSFMSSTEKISQPTITTTTTSLNKNSNNMNPEERHLKVATNLLLSSTTNTTNKMSNNNNNNNNNKTSSSSSFPTTNNINNMSAVQYKANKLKEMLVIMNNKSNSNKNNKNNNKNDNITLATTEEESAREIHPTD